MEEVMPAFRQVIQQYVNEKDKVITNEGTNYMVSFMLMIKKHLNELNNNQLVTLTYEWGRLRASLRIPQTSKYYIFKTFVTVVVDTIVSIYNDRNEFEYRVNKSIEAEEKITLYFNRKHKVIDLSKPEYKLQEIINSNKLLNIFKDIYKDAVSLGGDDIYNDMIETCNLTKELKEFDLQKVDIDYLIKYLDNHKLMRNSKVVVPVDISTTNKYKVHKWSKAFVSRLHTEWNNKYVNQLGECPALLTVQGTFAKHMYNICINEFPDEALIHNIIRKDGTLDRPIEDTLKMITSLWYRQIGLANNKKRMQLATNTLVADTNDTTEEAYTDNNSKANTEDSDVKVMNKYQVGVSFKVNVNDLDILSETSGIYETDTELEAYFKLLEGLYKIYDYREVLIDPKSIKIVKLS